MGSLAKTLVAGALGGALLWLFGHTLPAASRLETPVSILFHTLLFPPPPPYWLEDLILKVILGALAALLAFLLVKSLSGRRGAVDRQARFAADAPVCGGTPGIRPATTDDAPAIANLAGQLGYPSSSLQAAARLESIVALPGHIVMVAVSDETICGWVHAYVAQWLESDPFVEIGGLVVDSGYRGRGVGGRLVLAAQQWAAGQGVALLRVRSRADRAAAHAFYARQGFVRVKEQYVFDKILQHG